MAYDVKKDVHPFCGSDPEVDFVLFFTDNKNEPKKINIRRCIEDDTDFTGNALGYSGEDLKDFVMACPKTPTSTIQFDFQFDANRGDSNFKNTNGIQFAYQNVYIDGFVSSLSGYSEVAYPDAIERLGAQSISQIEVENICNLSIPRGSQEIARVRILFREGQDNVWQIIDEVSAKVDQGNENFFFAGPNDGTNEDQPLGYYTFYNDRVYPVISNKISKKNFDNLPKKAEGQAVADNRLMYANYVDGFDPVICRSEGSVVFRDRPKDLIDATLNVETTYIFNEDAVAGQPKKHGASCAFKIDSSGLPDVIPAGNYNLTINFRAEKNLHLYAAGKQYYGTNNIEREDNGLQFVDPEDFPSILGGGMPSFVNQGQDKGPETIDEAATLSFRGAPVDGVTEHPAILAGNWRGKVFNIAADEDEPTNELKYAMGSSPANPLIVPFGSSSINIVFRVDIDNLSNEQLGLNISNILTGSDYGIPGMSLLEAPGVEQQGDSVVLDHNIETGLEAGDVIKQTSQNSQLISAIVARQTSDPRNYPLGFVVLKSGNIKFTFEGVSNQSGVLFPVGGQTNPQTDTVRFVRMALKELNIEKEDFLTCLPRPVKGRGHVREDGGGFAISDSRDTLWGLSRFGIPNFQAKLQWPTIAFDLGPGATNPGFIRPKDQNAVEISAIDDIGDGGACFPGGLDLQQVGVGFRAAIPAPIDEWLLFDQAGINNNDASTGTRVRDYYSIDIPGLTSSEQQAFLDEIGVSDGSFPHSDPDLRTLLMGDGGGGITANSFSSCWQGFVDSVGLGSVIGGFYTPLAVSIVDGAAGPGGAGVDGAEDAEKFRFDLGDRYRICQVGDDVSDQTEFNGPQVPCANRYGSVWGSTLVGLVDNLPHLTFRGEYLLSGDTIPAYSKYQDANDSTPLTARTIGTEDLKSAPLNSLGSFLQVGTTGTSVGSFKTRDTHDFGLVYYDKRGRASTVFPIQSVYVPGYSDEERNAPGATKGPVSIRQKLLHDPPTLPNGTTWAERYKIVYSPASKISRFIQYSAGGAFINENQPTGAEDKIYVSLNYLQRKSISYSDAYGARDQDTGETTLYRFTPGDKLRVISYYEGEDARVWANDVAVFDVVGQEEFLKDQDEHPFLDDQDVTDAPNEEAQNPILRRTGSFVVLRNNKDATGFTGLDIRNGTDKWGNRCVFEITSYKNDLSDDIQVYYETPYGGTVDFNENVGRYQHSNTNIVIDYGDVFFRGVPVNFQLFGNDGFEDLIKYDTNLAGASSQSNFLNYYLESNSITDLYRSQTKGYGKMHFYNPDAEERRHEASITFSEKTDVQSGNLFYVFFSPLELNFFDLDIDYGAINYIASIGNELVSTQESKCSLLQVAKSMTTRADGTDDLISSDQVLSSPRYFVDEVGTAGNPESVVVANDTVYFADRNNFVVAAISPTGSMKIISDQGMSEFFESRFRNLNAQILFSQSQARNQGTRVVGGYDPLNKQFLITVKAPSSGNPDAEDSDVPSLAPVLQPDAFVEIPNIFPGSSSTTAYDVAGESGWLTRYSFLPTCYGFVGKDLVSFRFSENDNESPTIIWRHNASDDRMALFYGKQFLSFFKAVFNVDLFKSKNFNSISIEPSHESLIACRLTTKNEKTDIRRWKKYEDTEYAEIGRSVNEASSSFVSIGVVKEVKVSSGDGKFTDFQGNIVSENFDVSGSEVLCVEIEFENNVSQLAFNLNSYQSEFDSRSLTSSAVLFRDADSQFVAPFAFFNLFLIPHSILDKNTIRFIARNNGEDFSQDPIYSDYVEAAESEGISVFEAIIVNPPTPLIGSLLVIDSNAHIYGDKLRDKFAVLDFVYNGNAISGAGRMTKPFLEVSSVSVDVTESEFT
tara:strand:- start:4938 stop:10502 length:5565 start_codon:yes stop_codon:yes gene_type:complete